MSRQQRIHEKLQEALTPERLEVLDESAKHAGHAGASPEGETHYRVRIAASALAGLSRVESHRTINSLLQHEFDTGLHALAIEIRAA